MHYAAERGFFVPDAGFLEIIQWLVKQGADVKAKDDTGKTILYVAVESKNLELVQWLVGQGADVNAKDSCGWTVLHNAVRFSSFLEIVEWLVNQGADVNAKDNDGESVLFYAELSGTDKIQQWLKEHGAKVEVEQ